MNFGSWLQLITVFLGVAAGLYAIFRVLLAPVLEKIDNQSQKSEEFSKKLDVYMDGQVELRLAQSRSEGQHSDIFRRLKRLETDVDELRALIDELRK